MRTLSLAHYDAGKLLNIFIVCYAFTLPIAKAGTVLFELLLIITWFAAGGFKEKFAAMRESLLIKALAALVLLSAIAYFWSPDPVFWRGFMHKYWHFLIIPVIYTSLRRDYINPILTAFLAGMLISEIASYGLFFELWHFENVRPSDPSPFMDHTNYSIYLVITAGILLNRIFHEPRFWIRVPYLLFFLTVTANLFVNAGRTGQVAFAAVLLAIGFLNIRHKLKALLLMVLLGATIFGAAYTFSPVFKERADLTAGDVQQMVQEGKLTGAFTRRIALWVMGYHVFTEHPLLGTGIGNETSGVTKYVQQYEFSSYYDVQENTYLDYHSAFVQYAAQLGIVGLALFCLTLFSQFRLRFTTRIYFNLNITFAIAYCLLSTVGFSTHLMNSIVLFALFAGLFAAISRIETSPSARLNGIRATEGNA